MVTLKDAVAETRAHFDLQTCPARAPRHEDSLRPGRITTAMTRSETKAATWKYTSGSFRISEFTVRRRFRQEFLNSVIVCASCICRSPRLFLQGRCDILQPSLHIFCTTANHSPTIHQPFTNHSPLPYPASGCAWRCRRNCRAAGSDRSNRIKDSPEMGMPTPAVGLPFGYLT